ncbi:MAG: Polysaccharide biosynthesis protein [bacterium ADurb.Bin212]|nr:MAG: Polysaccharide biosynthesis protein [bacterium ADurb.Bin212]
MQKRLDKKAIFDNTFWQIVVRLFTLGLTLVSIKILTNYLGTEGVGKYNTITTYINFFIVFADLGLFAVTVREISQKPEKEKKVMSNVLTIRFWSALAASLVAISIVLLTDYDKEIKFGVIIATGFLFFNLLASVYDMLLQARLKMQYSALAEFLSRIISIVALVVIVNQRGSFLWVASTIALWGIFILIFKYLFASRYLQFAFAYDKAFSNNLMAMAWPLGIVFIVNNLYYKLDTLLLFAIKGAAAAGIYTVAFKVLEVITFMSSYFSSALKPAISQNIDKDKKAVANIIQKGISVMLIGATIISLLSIAYRNEIILLLSSPEFGDSARVLVFLALSLPIIFINTLLVEIFIANDSRSVFLKISIFIFIFNLLLNLLLIPRFSYFGAAVANLSSAITLMLTYFHFANKIINFRINWLTVAKLSVIVAMLAALAKLLTAWHVFFLGAIVIILVLYFVLLYVFKILSITDTFKLLLKHK